jgi:hypothetical protein
VPRHLAHRVEHPRIDRRDPGLAGEHRDLARDQVDHLPTGDDLIVGGTRGGTRRDP